MCAFFCCCSRRQCILLANSIYYTQLWLDYYSHLCFRGGGRSESVCVQPTGGSQTASTSTGTTSAQLQSQLSNLQHNILQQQSQQQLQQQPSLAPPDSPHHTHSSAPPSSSHLPEEAIVREHHHQHREREGIESPQSNNDMSPRSSWSVCFVLCPFDL